ncbi:hypothetical protein [Humisphaera borealis]|uniref:Uncharacterized protein n=1 Tax=Humisphaera borealis TaxID=2807512 RepID=A0A7M2WWC8_9BACT|nr:hypothetical protein [Humisphaera borealis]QOV89776.1 hypothetical protein IPV69_26940 [Humisphaera borealis]
MSPRTLLATSLVLTVATISAPAAPPTTGPATATAARRVLPARVEDWPRYAELQKAKAAAEARLAELGRAQPRPGQRTRRILTDDEERELGAIHVRMEALGVSVGGKSQPPEANLAELQRLDARRNRLLYGDPAPPPPRTHDDLRAEAEALSRVRGEQRAAAEAAREMLVLSNDLSAIRQARAEWAATSADVTAADLAAAPDRYAGKRVRLLDVTFVTKAPRVGGTPVDAQHVDESGALIPTPAKDRSMGMWLDATFLDAAGGRLPETYARAGSNIGSHVLTPGVTADVYGWVVRVPGREGAAFLCERVVPHGAWSGPPAPGFAAGAK